MTSAKTAPAGLAHEARRKKPTGENLQALRYGALRDYAPPVFYASEAQRCWEEAGIGCGSRRTCVNLLRRFELAGLVRQPMKGLFEIVRK